MTFEAVTLIVLVVSVVILGTRARARWRARPGYRYQRVFSAAAIGLLFLVAGLIGWDLSHSRGWFEGTRWVEGPIWWQVGIGLGGLFLAGVWARHAQPPVRR